MINWIAMFRRVGAMNLDRHVTASAPSCIVLPIMAACSLRNCDVGPS